MTVELIILHMNGVEIIRKGEKRPRTLFCPFVSKAGAHGYPEHYDGVSQCCGPWCPHFGGVERDFSYKTHAEPSEVGWMLNLTCGSGCYITTPNPEGFCDDRAAEEADIQNELERTLVNARNNH